MSGERHDRGGVRRLRSALLVATAVLVALTTVAGAESSTEEATFGADRIATQSLGAHLAPAIVSGVSARPDGGIVVDGDADVTSFDANGAPEPDASPQVGPEGQGFPAQGGKSLVLGEGRITRLDADGGIDTGFGQGGSIKDPGAEAVAELPSGRIVTFRTEAGGTRFPDLTGYVELFEPDGRAVPGSTSSRELPAYPGIEPIREVLVTPGGGVLIVNSSFLLELRADGSPDPGFGHEGVVEAELAISGARILAGGAIEVLGVRYHRPGEREVPAVERLDAAGNREEAFGDKGIRALTRRDSWWDLDAVSWGTDGSAILAGRQLTAGCTGDRCVEAPVLIGVDPEGSVEAGFGEGGILRLGALAGTSGRESYASEGVAAIARRPDGSIVAAGNAPPDESVGFIAAFDPAGTLIPSFGEGGIARFSDTTYATERIAALAPVGGGKLLAAGWTDVGAARGAMSARYDADGSLDRSFGRGSGWSTLARYGRESTLLAVRDGVALIATYEYPRSTLLMVHVESGSPVRRFGAQGAVRLPRRRDPTAALAFAADGDPVVLDGAATAYYSQDFVVHRYRRDGGLDRSFGHGGESSPKVPFGGLKDRVMVAAPEGGFLIGGQHGSRLAVAHLLADGRLDPRFGSHGWSVTHVPGSADSLSMVRDGSRVLLATTVGRGEHRRLVLVRLDADGRRDESFGRDGVRSAKVRSGWPVATILPSAGGTTVLLKGGLRPVITFAANGGASSRPVGPRTRGVSSVSGAISGGRLIVGWSRGYGGSAGFDYSLSSLPLRP